MDSGGILCLHYPFCCRVALGARMVHAAHVHPARRAGVGRAVDDPPPPLGAAGRDYALALRWP